MTRLTPNFTLEELVHSDTAVRLGIDNTPPPDVVQRLLMLAQGLEEMRAMLGGVPLNVSSGYRCEALERVLCEKDFGGWCRRHRKDPASREDILNGAPVLDVQPGSAAKPTDLSASQYRCLAG